MKNEKELVIITIGTYYDIPIDEIGLFDTEARIVSMRGSYTLNIRNGRIGPLHVMKKPDIFTHIYWRLESEYKMPILDIISGCGDGVLYSIKYA